MLLANIKVCFYFLLEKVWASQHIFVVHKNINRYYIVRILGKETYNGFK